MKAQLALWLAVLAWGLEYPVMKRATAEFGVLGTGAVMFSVGSLLVGVVLLLRKGSRVFLEPSPKTYALMVLIGILGVVLNGCTLIAIRLTNAVNVATLHKTDVFFSLVLSSLVFRERVDRAAWFFAPVMVLGITVMTGFLFHPLDVDYRALSLLLLSALLIALNGYIIKIATREASPLLVGFLNTVLNAMAFLIGFVIVGDDGIKPVFYFLARPKLLLLGLLSGVFFACYNTALRTIPVWFVRLGCLLMPVIAGLAGWIWLHEPLTPMRIGGMALVCGGAAGIIRIRRG